GQQNSVVSTWASQATSFFNVNPGGAVSQAPGVTVNGQQVSLDISHLTPGTPVTLAFDLVGNPPGTASSATLSNVQINQQASSDAFSVTPLAGPFGVPSGIAAGDVDGDSHEDIVVADSGLNQLLVYNGDGAGGFTRSTLSVSSFGSSAVAVAAGPLT